MRTCILVILILVCIPIALLSNGVKTTKLSAPLCSASQDIIADEITYSYEALTNGTIRLSVHNNASLGININLTRERGIYPTNGVDLIYFFVPAGSSYFYIDDAVTPGIPYVYFFAYHFDGSNWILFEDHITPVSTVPALGTFNVFVPPDPEDYDWLWDGYEIQIETTDIVASASNDGVTQSVVFYLNGHRSIDNTYPFSLFGDVPVRAKVARLKDGDYSLVAVAYPEKHGKGIPGDTARINFRVNIIWFVLNVSVAPNPVREKSVVTVNGEAGAPIKLELIGQSGLTRQTLYQGNLNQEGQYQYTIDANNFPKGLYIVLMRTQDRTIQQRIFIE